MLTMSLAACGTVSNAWQTYARQRYWSEGGEVPKYRFRHVQAILVSPNCNNSNSFSVCFLFLELLCTLKCQVA